MTPMQSLAWQIYCDETKGAMGAMDNWWDLTSSAQVHFITKAEERMMSTVQDTDNVIISRKLLRDLTHRNTLGDGLIQRAGGVQVTDDGWRLVEGALRNANHGDVIQIPYDTISFTAKASDGYGRVEFGFKGDTVGTMSTICKMDHESVLHVNGLTGKLEVDVR